MTYPKKSKSSYINDSKNDSDDDQFMLKDGTFTVYKSGNSNVITIPSSWPIKAGDEIKVEKITKAKSNKATIDKNIKKLHKIAGTLDLEVKGMSAEDIDEILEGVYD